jgi:DNA-binding NarL/FixJ family response regulator
MHNDEEFILNSIKSGAKGYLPKDIGRDELLKAIYSISNGEEYFSKDISDTILKGIIKKTKSESRLLNKVPTLTNREIEIIKLVAEGFLNKEIANKLYISIRTVDSHKKNIMQKLKLKSTVDLVKYAIKNNLIEL